MGYGLIMPAKLRKYIIHNYKSHDRFAKPHRKLSYEFASQVSAQDVLHYSS